MAPQMNMPQQALTPDQRRQAMIKQQKQAQQQQPKITPGQQDDTVNQRKAYNGG